ncbi:hypothetical protein ACOME3_003314 [Neoechinorhynchus agilis]
MAPGFNSTLPRQQTANKPCPFQLDNTGEWYYIGSEVGAYLRLYRGTLYKKYPGLWRRLVTPEERKRLIEQGIMRSSAGGGGGDGTLPTNLTLVRVVEVNEILCGGDDSRFRSSSSLQTVLQPATYPYGDDFSNSQFPPSAPLIKPALPSSSSSAYSKTMRRSVYGSMYAPIGAAGSMSFSAGVGGGGNSMMSSQSSQNFYTSASQQLLETVPTQTPIPPRPACKKRAYPLCFDDMDPDAVERNARLPEILVPIRLEIDLDGQKLRDFCLWNKNETLISPEVFAELTCEELDLNPIAFVPAIASSIRRQLDAFPVENVHPPGYLVTIKLNIQIGNTSLVDKFEWDITNERNSPEEFARVLAADLGLGNEFVCSIAFAIRSQLAYHRKNHNSSIDLGDESNGGSASAILKRDGPFRTPQEAEEYCPKVETLSDVEMEKKLRDQDRNARRIRRTAGVTGTPW